MENYEKKYKEALIRARSMYESRDDAELAAYIFPELAESEDERVRKEIVSIVQSYRDSCISEGSHRFDDCLAWLEKQKPSAPNEYDEKMRKKIIDHLESIKMGCVICTIDTSEEIAWLEKQKEIPKSAISIPADCASNAKCENRWYKVTDFLPDSGRDVLAKDALGNYLIAHYDGDRWYISGYDNEDKPIVYTPAIKEWCDIPSEKQKEQKQTLDLPAGFYFIDKNGKKYYTDTLKCGNLKFIANQKEQEPADEQDYSGLSDLERAIHRGFLCAGVDNVPVAIIKETAQECLAQIKPAEWSEEDSDILRDAICATDILAKDFKKDNPHLAKTLRVAKEWLEFLPTRFTFAIKQEWDEFDEDCLKRAIWYVENPAPSVVKDSRLVVWLNMLRSRFFLKPQQKEEWTEEDEKMKERLITRLNWITYNTRTDGTSPNITFFDEIAWLKSLHPHPKIEWSKEDEEHLKWLCRIIHSRKVHGELSLEEESELGNWMDKWLNHNPRPSWKPSEEQMSDLADAINKYVPAMQLPGLTTLYKDLMKLI